MSTPRPHRLRMARAAALHRSLADLRAKEAAALAELAGIFTEMAEGETVNLETGKRRAPVAEPVIPPPSDLAKARAHKALQQAAQRRRVSR